MYDGDGFWFLRDRAIGTSHTTAFDFHFLGRPHVKLDDILEADVVTYTYTSESLRALRAHALFSALSVIVLTAGCSQRTLQPAW